MVDSARSFPPSGGSYKRAREVPFDATSVCLQITYHYMPHASFMLGRENISSTLPASHSYSFSCSAFLERQLRCGGTRIHLADSNNLRCRSYNSDFCPCLRSTLLKITREYLRFRILQFFIYQTHKLWPNWIYPDGVPLLPFKGEGVCFISSNDPLTSESNI